MAHHNVNSSPDPVGLVESILDLLPVDIGNRFRLFKLTSIQDLIERLSSLDFPATSDILHSSIISLGQLSQNKRLAINVDVVPIQRRRENYEVRHVNGDNNSGTNSDNAGANVKNNPHNNSGQQDCHYMHFWRFPNFRERNQRSGYRSRNIRDFNNKGSF